MLSPVLSEMMAALSVIVLALLFYQASKVLGSEELISDQSLAGVCNESEISRRQLFANRFKQDVVNRIQDEGLKMKYIQRTRRLLRNTNSVHGSKRTVPKDSCRGKCGVPQSLPCSCHENCVVYNNCCEDLADRCPGLVARGRQLYHRQMAADVKCLNSFYFVVASCPSDHRRLMGTSQQDIDFRGFFNI